MSTSAAFDIRVPCHRLRLTNFHVGETPTVWNMRDFSIACRKSSACCDGLEFDVLRDAPVSSSVKLTMPGCMAARQEQLCSVKPAPSMVDRQAHAVLVLMCTSCAPANENNIGGKPPVASSTGISFFIKVGL